MGCDAMWCELQSSTSSKFVRLLIGTVLFPPIFRTSSFFPFTAHKFPVIRTWSSSTYRSPAITRSAAAVGTFPFSRTWSASALRIISWSSARILTISRSRTFSSFRSTWSLTRTTTSCVRQILRFWRHTIFPKHRNLTFAVRNIFTLHSRIFFFWRTQGFRMALTYNNTIKLKFCTIRNDNKKNYGCERKQFATV